MNIAQTIQALGDHPLHEAMRAIAPMAKRYAGPTVEFEDLVQSAVVGFLAAWEKLETRPRAERWQFLHQAWQWAMLDHFRWRMSRGRVDCDYREPGVTMEQRVEIRRALERVRPEVGERWQKAAAGERGYCFRQGPGRPKKGGRE